MLIKVEWTVEVEWTGEKGWTCRFNIPPFTLWGSEHLVLGPGVYVWHLILILFASRVALLFFLSPFCASPFFRFCLSDFLDQLNFLIFCLPFYKVHFDFEARSFSGCPCSSWMNRRRGRTLWGCWSSQLHFITHRFFFETLYQLVDLSAALKVFVVVTVEPLICLV